MPMCSKCVNSSFCLNCDDAANLKDGLCTICNYSCLTCVDGQPNKCTSCRDGLRLSIDSACTDSCPLGCQKCTQTRCLECQDEFTLDGDGACIRCIMGCSGTCNPYNISQCVKCAAKSYLSNGVCLQCPKGCSGCVDGSCW